MSRLLLILFSLLSLNGTPVLTITVGSCHIRNEAGNAVATATFRGQPPRYGYTTYSCVANDNCDNEVHVLGNYESNGHSGFRVHNTGYTNVYLTVTGNSSRPLVLVLSSYEPVEWTLRIPNGVLIHKVIISSYYNSSAVYPHGQVTSVENNGLRLIGYGSNSGTQELLTYIGNRFGPVSSFTGTYQADQWSMTINRRDPDPNCVSAPPTQAFTQVSDSSDTAIPLSTIIIVVIVLALPFVFCIVAMIVGCSVAKRRNMARPSGTSVGNSRQFVSRPPAVSSGNPFATPQVVYAPQNNFQFSGGHSARPPIMLPENPHVAPRVAYPQQNDCQLNSAPTDGVLMDSAPPSYQVALNFPSPTTKTSGTTTGTVDGKHENEETQLNPPPYPG